VARLVDHVLDELLARFVARQPGGLLELAFGAVENNIVIVRVVSACSRSLSACSRFFDSVSRRSTCSCGDQGSRLATRRFSVSRMSRR
jgi:hypothetical protein